MIRATILTPWTGTGTEDDSNRPLIGDVYKIQKWEDKTGQPVKNLHPDPNLYAIEVLVEEVELVKIKLDNRFYVVWEYSGKETIMPAVEFTKLKTYLTAQGTADVDSVLGLQVDSRDRGAIGRELKAWLRTRPKAKEVVMEK